jgi:hypothetical protein
VTTHENRKKKRRKKERQEEGEPTFYVSVYVTLCMYKVNCLQDLLACIFLGYDIEWAVTNSQEAL